jgi:hypothetical protein
MAEVCESCGKSRKRYRSAFSSWICDNCKKETVDYEHPDAFIKVMAYNWWSSLSHSQRIKIYLRETN